MRLSELISTLEAHKKMYGDMDVVLWDLDTSVHYVMDDKAIELQFDMTHSLRLAIGLASWSGIVSAPGKRA